MTQEHKYSFENTKLLHKDILVKAEGVSRKSETGIIMTTRPSIIDDRPTEGIVEKVSSKVKNVKVGDKVWFAKASGLDHFYPDKPGEWFILLDCKRILGKVEKLE